MNVFGFFVRESDKCKGVSPNLQSALFRNLQITYICKEGTSRAFGAFDITWEEQCYHENANMKLRTRIDLK